MTSTSANESNRHSSYQIPLGSFDATPLPHETFDGWARIDYASHSYAMTPVQHTPITTPQEQPEDLWYNDLSSTLKSWF